MNEAPHDTLFFAFISYSHKDEKTAEWLTKELEHFQIPASIVGVPRSLRPIFRDKEELSAGNLPEQISTALAQSWNLIVICSPSSAKSKWVDKEIQEFIVQHNGSAAHVFPFIIDGEPYAEQEENECYPPSLRSIADSEERLGVHLKKDSRKKISLIRLMAGLLGVRFDSLWQRHEQELRRKRITRKALLSIIVIAFLFIMGALWSSRRNNLATQSVKAAELAQKFIHEGDYVIAKRIAMEALPRKIAFPIDRPFVSEASEALFHAWEKEQQNKGRRWQMPTSQFPIPKKTSTVAISPDCTHVVTAEEGVLRVWDSNTGESVGKPMHGQSISISAIAFSHDGKKLISGDSYHEIILWDFSKRKPLMRCVPKDILTKNDSLSTSNRYQIRDNDYVRELVFSPDDRFFASRSSDGLFRVWDAQSCEELAISPKYEKDYTSSIAFNHDATKIITGDGAGNTRIWGRDGMSLQCEKTIPGESGPINAVAFNHSGTRFVSASRNAVIIWDAMSLQELPRPTFGDRYLPGFKDAWFTADDKQLILADRSTLYFIDPETGAFIHDDKILGGGSIASRAPDGAHFVSSSTANNNMVSVWNLRHAYDSVSWRRDDHQGEVTALTFDDRGTILVSGADDGKIIVRDPQTGTPLREPITLNGGKVTSLSFNPQGNLLVSMTSDKRAMVWNLEDGNFLCELPAAGEDLSFVAFRGDDTIVSHGDFSDAQMTFHFNAKGIVDDSFTEYRFFMFDIGRDTLETNTIRLPMHLRVTFSDNFKLAANEDSKVINIYSTESGKRIACLQGHSESVTEVLFGKEGRKAITYSPGEHSLKVWDIKREKELMTIPVESLSNMTLSRNERFLAIVEDDTVQIWDLKRAAKLLTVHNIYTVSEIAISPEGDRIALGSHGTVALYNISLQMLLDKTRNQYPSLTAAQKKQYNL